MICEKKRMGRKPQAYQLRRLGRTVGAFMDCACAVRSGIGLVSSIPSSPSAVVRGPCRSSTEAPTAWGASSGGT
jgi:hypothetical protein